MNSEIGISDEFEEFDDEIEFRRLIRSIELAQKYFLHFVCCNQITRQNELIKQAIETLPDKKVEVINFKEPITDLLTEIETNLKNKKPDAVFVQGLFHSIKSDGKGKENRLIHNLNISRDSFRSFLDCPMFLWLPEYAIVKITRNAPDFFSVRSGTFYFSSSHEKVTEQIFQSVSPSWTEISSLSIEEKRKRTKSLKNLLEEYQGLPKAKQDKYLEVHLLSHIASIYSSISEYQKAIRYYELSLEILKQIGDKKGEGVELNNLGIVHYNLGDHQKAINYYEQALLISIKTKDKHGEASNLGNLGNVYLNIGENNKALDYIKSALTISEEIDDKVGIKNRLGSLGNAHMNLDEFNKAIKYYKKALNIAQAINDKFGQGTSFGNLGIAYQGLGEYNKAIKYYEESLKISREIGDRHSEGRNHINLASTHANLEDFKKAKSFAMVAKDIFNEIKSPYAQIAEQMIVDLNKKLRV